MSRGWWSVGLNLAGHLCGMQRFCSNISVAIVVFKVIFASK